METKAPVVESPKVTFREYYNISEYRTKLWNGLKDLADMVSQKSTRDNLPNDLVKHVHDCIADLKEIELYWAFPGIPRLDKLERILIRGEYHAFSNAVNELVRLLVSKSFYNESPELLEPHEEENHRGNTVREGAHYFEVLIVDDISEEEEEELRAQLHQLRAEKDNYHYEIVVVKTFQDALIALSFNHNIQSCLIRYSFPFKSKNNIRLVRQFVNSLLLEANDAKKASEIGPFLGKKVRELRPELDLFFVTDITVDNISDEVLDNFRTIFYRQEDLQDLHLNILKGIYERFETPFYNALVSYSKQPTGVFHAMPISRGNSIFKSNWIKEMGDFYGRNIFLAETSATTGGLDSLLQPVGPLKKAQKMAARAFGSRQSFFVTNGTSTANKVVLQALVQPEDIVLIDRDCHKSHHYGLMLSGAFPVYLDSFQIEKYSMYGAVPLEEIKHTLHTFRDHNKLGQVKMLLLTNCTFDGMVYNVERFMEEVLAIKPDMIFLWDEAWFAFARFSALYRQRTAMAVAEKLYNKYRSREYRDAYEAAQEKGFPNGPMPDPDRVKIRVYATQSTHKTLTSLRQGSMIHVYDELFAKKVEDSFFEAYMTHTSTSPSYQILASLDMGRRQVELEGNELVEKAVERAMMLRVKIANNPLLRKYFDILTVGSLIPSQFRPSGFKRYYDKDYGWSNMEAAWKSDEFVLDPTKINLYIGRTGIDGDTFKKVYLMDQFGIQVNKTSRNTVLFMTNIGTTRSSVAKLIGCLLKIARQIEQGRQSMSKEETAIHKRKVVNLTENLPSLPNFSYFHKHFRNCAETPEGNIRKAFFLAYDDNKCECMRIEECEAAMQDGREIVSASFVIPYPPGFPVLVPGQVMTHEILGFMKELDVKEIHSYNPELGFRVFSEQAIRELATDISNC